MVIDIFARLIKIQRLLLALVHAFQRLTLPSYFTASSLHPGSCLTYPVPSLTHPTRISRQPTKKGGELVELATRRRDERMAQVAEDLGAKRKESLLDMHQKSAKKAKVGTVAMDD